MTQNLTELEKIKKQFDRVIEYSQGIPEPQTFDLFERWLEAKRDIIEAFGGKFIYEYPHPVSFEITQSAKEDRIQSFINYLWDIDLPTLSDFLEVERDGFFSNLVIKDYTIYNTSGEEITVIKKGAKLVKCFKHFLKDKKRLSEIQNKASMIIQENKIEGTLCFSVHPLDYLSISENNHNWRSCHALDGEYRAGNISYMTDKATIVCYLKGKEDVVLPRFPEDVKWNSKKWRVLLYLSNNWTMVFAGKQYPFSSASGMQFIIDNCFNAKNHTNKYVSHWSSWINHKISEISCDDINYDIQDTYVPLEGGLIPLKELMKDAEGSKHFNDVLKSSCYDPEYSILIGKQYWGNEQQAYTSASTTKFTIGDMTYCLQCGKEETLLGTETMRCYNCELKYGTTENDTFAFCAECGERYDTENGSYINDMFYCTSCFNHKGTQCSNCGDYDLKEDMIYDEKTDEYYCSFCRHVITE